MPKNDLFPPNLSITQKERSTLSGHRALVIWFTGLSGAGKTTLANTLEAALYQASVHTYLLDGDNVRSGLNSDLDFSLEGREENLRRVGELAKLFLDAGVVTLCTFISPYRKNREWIKNRVGAENFVEVFVDCPLETCERRDVKGLYKRARAGEIKDFTGIDAPFEEPEKPDIYLNTSEQALIDCIQILVDHIVPKLKLL